MGLWVQGVRIVPVFAVLGRFSRVLIASGVRVKSELTSPARFHYLFTMQAHLQTGSSGGGTVPPEKRFRINLLRGVRWRVFLARLLIVALSSVAALYLAELAARQFFPEWGPTRAERVQFWRYDTLLG
ncbi:MAG: hypothetical protein O3B24_10910 [Verrucomicrobia bacterium]|nr:hypothetical protein [Verrucomicrobiota bacterium]